MAGSPWPRAKWTEKGPGDPIKTRKQLHRNFLMAIHVNTRLHTGRPRWLAHTHTHAQVSTFRMHKLVASDGSARTQSVSGGQPGECPPAEGRAVTMKAEAMHCYLC